MKTRILIGIMLFVSASLYSQHVVEPYLEYSLNWSRFNQGSPVGGLSEYKHVPFTMGISMHIRPCAHANKFWSVYTGLFYNNKKALFSMEDAKGTYGFRNLEIPLMASYRIPVWKGVISAYVSAGGFVSYAVGGKTAYTQNGVTCKADTFDDKINFTFNKWDAGPRFSFGLGSPGSRSGLSVDYDWGMVNLLKNGNGHSPVKSGTWYLTFKLCGLMFVKGK